MIKLEVEHDDVNIGEKNKIFYVIGSHENTNGDVYNREAVAIAKNKEEIELMFLWHFIDTVEEIGFSFLDSRIVLFHEERCSG